MIALLETDGEHYRLEDYIGEWKVLKEHLSMDEAIAIIEAHWKAIQADRAVHVLLRGFKGKRE